MNTEGLLLNNDVNAIENAVENARLHSPTLQYPNALYAETLHVGRTCSYK